MAKGSKKRKNKAQGKALPENALPQNILPMGERVEQNKNIYITQEVYKQVHRFTKNKTTNESGGMLVGTVIDELGKTNILISGFIEAKYCEGTPTTLTFTHETWEYVHQELERKHKGKKIVGWIHTHPDFGIFLSEYDKFIHQNFFSEDHQVAYVVDPIQHIEGFYFWINGNLERCKGFYIYDKTGTAITVDPNKDEPASSEEGGFRWKDLMIALLSVVVAFLIFSNISTNNKLEELEKQQETWMRNVNQTLQTFQQTIFTQGLELQNLKAELAPETQPETDPTEGPTEPTVEEEPTEDPTEPTEEGGTENE